MTISDGGAMELSRVHLTGGFLYGRDQNQKMGGGCVYVDGLGSLNMELGMRLRGA